MSIVEDEEVGLYFYNCLTKKKKSQNLNPRGHIIIHVVNSEKMMLFLIYFFFSFFFIVAKNVSYKLLHVEVRNSSHTFTNSNWPSWYFILRWGGGLAFSKFRCHFDNERPINTFCKTFNLKHEESNGKWMKSVLI